MLWRRDGLPEVRPPANGRDIFAASENWVKGRAEGIIALSGMIMRNSVILVVQIEQDEKAGMDTWNAIIEATVRRFRPILLTAAAAILAMIPLSFNDFFGPQAIAIMGGLIVATGLTIFFLPALYAAWFRVGQLPQPNGFGNVSPSKQGDH